MTVLAIAAIALLACGTGVREVRNVGGEKVYEAKCKSSASDCIADARATCSEGYEVLDSESHAGGIAADALPGPVTWYTLTFKCSGFASGERPSFPFRGQQYRPSSAPPPGDETMTVAPTSTARAATPKAARSCSSDLECGVGRQCVKQQFQFQGVCAQTVDEFGMPTYAPPRGNSLGPGDEGDCSFDTECPIGFHCIKGSALKGHCMK